jgi:hypothetical protein
MTAETLRARAIGVIAAAHATRPEEVVDALLAEGLLVAPVYDTVERGFLDERSGEPEELRYAPGPVLRGEVQVPRFHRRVLGYRPEVHGPWQEGDDPSKGWNWYLARLDGDTWTKISDLVPESHAKYIAKTHASTYPRETYQAMRASDG